jgi:hypothetical protein
MKEILNPKQMCKDKTKQEKGKIPKHIQNFRSLTRELNPPSKRGLPTSISMSCTNNISGGGVCVNILNSEFSPSPASLTAKIHELNLDIALLCLAIALSCAAASSSTL